MKQQYLEAGQIVNTHGLKGEVKIMPWTDSPEVLCTFPVLYLDGKPVNILAARAHKTMVLATIEGVTTVEEAMRLKGKTLYLDRNDVELPEGRHFLADLMGLTVIDNATGATLGAIHDILTPPAHEVYVVRGGEREYMIPAVDAFIAETNVDEGYIRVNLIEGL